MALGAGLCSCDPGSGHRWHIPLSPRALSQDCSPQLGSVTAALNRGEKPLKADFSACRVTRNGTGGEDTLVLGVQPHQKKDPDNSHQLCPCTCSTERGGKYLCSWQAQGMLRCWCFSPQTSMSVRAETRASTSAGTAWAASSVPVPRDTASCPTAKPAKVRRAIPAVPGGRSAQKPHTNQARDTAQPPL